MPETSNADFRTLFAGQASLADERVDLPRSALYLAGEEYPSLPVDEYLGRIDGMAEEVRQRAGPAADRESLARNLNQYLFDRRQFTGNPQDYYNPENSFLNRVMDTGVGIPITLSVLYLGIAGRLGLRCYGVGMPGHFLVGLQDLDLYLDPFHSGQLLSAGDCRRLAAEMFGPSLEWRDEFLAPCPNKLILYRMLNNLRQIYLSGRDFRRHVAALERMLLFEPTGAPLYLELAQAQVHIGDSEAALSTLETLLARSNNEGEIAVARRLSETLRRNRGRVN